MSEKQRFLDASEREHATTLKVLRAYPADQLELRPHPRAKNARELAWMFALEPGLGERVMEDALGRGQASGEPPAPPESWDELLDAVESGHRSLLARIRAMPDDELRGTVKSFTGPRRSAT